MQSIDIINIVLSISTIILSLIAIIISLNTSKKQNKIALFEKRMMVYELTEKFILVGEKMRECELTQKNNCIKYFFHILLLTFYNGEFHEINEEDINKLMFSISSIVDSSDFLFDRNISSALHELQNLIFEIEQKRNEKDVMNLVSDFSSRIISFSEKQMPEIKRNLKL